MRFQKKHGYTLIELLVVITIIAILAGLLFPALSKARETAQDVFCMSNCRNYAGAYTLYANDNGYYQSVLEQDNQYRNTFFYAYDNPELHACPMDKVVRKKSGWSGTPGAISYSVNGFLCGYYFVSGNWAYYNDGDEGKPFGKTQGKYQPMKPENVKFASRVVMFGECWNKDSAKTTDTCKAWSQDLWCLQCVGFSSYNPAAAGFMRYHGKKGNMAFADGHCGKLGYQDVKNIGKPAGSRGDMWNYKVLNPVLP